MRFRKIVPVDPQKEETKQSKTKAEKKNYEKFHNLFKVLVSGCKSYNKSDENGNC